MTAIVRGVPACALVLAVAAILVTAAGCGSSKPGYCADRSNLEGSVKGLADVNLQSGGLSAVESQLKQVESDAKALVASARSDFPNQTSAIDSSVSALTSAIDALPASPSPQQLAGLVPVVTNVGTAVSDFTNATSSSCD